MNQWLKHHWLIKDLTGFAACVVGGAALYAGLTGTNITKVPGKLLRHIFSPAAHQAPQQDEPPANSTPQPAWPKLQP